MKEGLIIVAIGIFMLIASLRKESVDKIKYRIPAATVVLVGIVISVLEYLEYQEYISVVIGAIMGAIFIFLGTYGFLNKIRCTSPVTGEYVGSEVEKRGKGRVKYKPRFVYEIYGQIYENSALDCFNERYIKKTYEVGKRYDIYVNPDNTHKLVTKKEMGIEEIIFVFFGVVFIIAGFTTI